MYKTIVAAGALSLAFSTFTIAQEAVSENRPTVLDRLLVTGGLTPVEQDKTGRAYTVITGEELARRQTRYVVDALRTVPGFSVARSGSNGGLTQVNVRGAEANHLLVMIDGIEASETSTGEFDFGSLLVDDIERIEILRGPQSAFWGSNAMAGVVNIITRRGARGGFTTTARSETGTDGTFLGGVGLSGGEKNYDIALSGAWRRSDGFNVSDFGSEKDGDENLTLNGKFTYDLSPNLTLDGTLRRVDRESDTDPQSFTSGLVIDGGDRTATEEFFGSLRLQHVSLDGALTQTARVTASDTFREYVSDAFPRSWNDGNRINAGYRASYGFATPGIAGATHTITGGYEFERETFLPSNLSERLARESNSFVAEYRGTFLDQFDLNGAIRHDLNDAFQDATTYSVAGSWRIPDTGTRLHASIGTGVTDPTFDEQFGVYAGQFQGNPDLVPEESFGWDIGIEQRFLDDRLIVDVTYFDQDLTNEITTDYSLPVPSPINQAGESKRQGVEVAATLDLMNGFRTTATYTYLDATGQANAGDPRQREIRRPEHSGSLNMSYRFLQERAEIFGEVIFNGEVTDVAFVPGLPSRVTLDPYEVVTVGGSYRLTDNLEAFGRIENLLDEEYEEIFGYNTQGREAFVGLRGRF